MTATQLLDHLTDRGATLWEEDGALHFKAPSGVITGELKDELLLCKEEILVLLSTQSNGGEGGVPQLVPDPVSRHEPFPLSDIQSAYLIGRDPGFELGGVGCHAYYELERETVDPVRLGRAIHALIRRHESLRLVFLKDGRQRILETVPEYRMKVHDLSWYSERDREKAHEGIRDKVSHRVHTTHRWPLFELGVIKLKGVVRLYFSLDLLIADFFSASILFKELLMLYDNPDRALASCDVSFRDYVLAEKAHQNTKAVRDAEAYWMGRLDDFPAAPELPFATALSAVKKPRFKRRETFLDKAGWERIKLAGARLQLTPSVILITAYAAVLARWSKDPHFAINLTLFNRLPVHPRIMEVVGDFTTVSLLELHARPGEPFAESAGAVQRQLWDDMDHRQYSGVRFIRELARVRGQKGRAMMPVVFSSTLGVETETDEGVDPGGLGSLEYGITQTPQVCLDHQVVEHDGGLFFVWDAVEELFPEGVLDEMFAAYTGLLDTLAHQDGAWGESLGSLVRHPASQPEKLQGDAKAFTADLLIHTLFERHAARAPGKAAVVTANGMTLSYGELNTMADELAGAVRAHVHGAGEPVALIMEKGWEQVAGVLGILKSGAAYLPIDPEVPRERRDQIIADGGVGLVVTTSTCLAAQDWPASVTVMAMDRLEKEPSVLGAAPDDSKGSPSDLAYVIYTSGSTGTPKGVMISHRSAMNTLLDVNERLGIGYGDKVFAVSALNFDLSVFDIFGTLSAGGTIVMPDPSAVHDPASWCEAMEAHGVTVWNSAPQLMKMLTDYLRGRTLSSALRHVMLSGDWIPLPLPGEIKTLFPHAAVYSLGGATEASIWSIMYPVAEVLPGWKSIPYGTPLSNQYFYVLGKDFSPKPLWAVGDLYIGGAGLAMGYRNDARKTAESFVIHPRTGERLYRTGDLGRIMGDGTIEFLGRDDTQVKINGYRIELGEIETVLKHLPSVSDAVVTASGDRGEARTLAAHVVADTSVPSELTRSVQGRVDVPWADFEAVLAQGAEALSGPDTDAAFKHILAYLEHVTCRSILSIFRGMGVFSGPGERRSLADILKLTGVESRFHGVVAQWVKVLVMHGLAEQEGGDYLLCAQASERCRDDAGACAGELAGHEETRWFPHRLDGYLEALVPHVPFLLQGETEPLSLFFGGDGALSPEALSVLLPGFDAVEAFAVKAVGTLISMNGGDKPLRILEIGSGTGKRAKQLMPMLRGKDAVLTCSDLSSFFTEKITDCLAGLSCVETRVLDIEGEIEPQGVDLHSFDLILASNAMHRAKDIHGALTNARRLLAPGGVLLVTEGVVNSSLQKVTTGLLEEGFSRFTDDRAQSALPLLSASSWKDALRKAGFKDVGSPFSGEHGVSGFSLFMGRAPEKAEVLCAERVAAALSRKIPGYMVPGAYHFLTAMPVTPNGKVDRRALASTKVFRRTTAQGAEPPESPMEQKIALIWERLLGLETGAIADRSISFFELGGDSLTGTAVVAEIREKTGVDLSLRSLFDSPTIKALAGVLDQGEGRSAPAKTELSSLLSDPQGRFEPFALSDVQHAYLAGRSGAYELGGVAAHCYFEFESPGLDIGRAESALRRLIEFHDMMRVEFDAVSLTQTVLETVPPYEIKVWDLRGLDEPARNRRLDHVRQTLSHEVLDVTSWPVFDIQASLMEGGKTRLHVSFDNIVLDGWSMFHLLNQWSRLYAAPDTPLPPVSATFRDYTLACGQIRETDLYRRSRDYWLRRIPLLPAAPEIPLWVRPEPGETYRFKRHHTTLDPSTWTALKQRAKKAGITASAFLLTAYSEVLALWSGQSRFTINLTLFNRFDLHPGIDEVVGDFTSLTLLEVNRDLSGSFTERGATLQGQLWEDLDYPYFSGVEVLREISRERGDYRSAAMPVVFTSALGLDQADEDAIGRNHLGEFVFGLSQTPQVLLDHQVYETSGALTLVWDFAEALFCPGVVKSMFDAYVGLLTALSQGPDLWEESSVVALPEEQQRIRAEVNSTRRVWPGQMLHGPFEARARTTPQRTAVISATRSLTYGELDGYGHAIAGELMARGARPNTLVAVVMERGWEQVAGVLGILKSGAAYLPISVDTPTERLHGILCDGEVSLVLTQSRLEKRFAWPDEVTTVCVDLISPAENPGHSLGVAQDPENLAYVIYTSGSTGKPKGVMITHGSAVNTVLDMNERFRVGDGDRVLAISELHFDLSVYDMAGPLSAGGALVIPDPGFRGEPRHWCTLVAEHKVTLWNSVPALFQMLMAHLDGKDASLLSSLETVLLSGDWIPLDLPKQASTLLPQASLTSLGGATEASIWSVTHPIKEVDPGWKSIPYGRPMANQTLYVLDEEFRACPDWVPGTIYIGGRGLAAGYWNEEEKTAAAFVLHPKTGERIYRTGDLGRYHPGGVVEFLGRDDYQVKIGGYRIELEEVESCLLDHPAVAGAVVTVREWERGTMLVGHAVLKACREGADSPDEESLLDFLATKLPPYMIPGSMNLMASFPLTSNGKIDRKNLSARPVACGDSSARVAPETELEEALAAIWRGAFERDAIGVTDSFFALGGNSLLSIQVLSRIHRELGVELPLHSLFEAQTIRKLAEFMETYKAAEAWSPLVALQTESEGTPLFWVHPSDGNIFYYNRVSECLRDDMPSYGLQAHGLSSSMAPLTSIEEMAAHYIKAIQTVQKHGPYHLGGWCMGGFVAYEMARQLQGAGHTVRRLVLVNTPTQEQWLDSYLKVGESFLNLMKLVVEDIQTPLDFLGMSPEAFSDRPREEQYTLFYDGASFAGLLPRDMSLGQFKLIIPVVEANMGAMCRYSPQGVAIEKTLFVKPETGDGPDVAAYWRGRIRGHMEVATVPGTHETVLALDAGCGHIAGKLRGLLAV
ncbi:non-ribosomal peptide synthetase [Desulfoluna spongiiphila]|uniref:non-ribosomal peptide synthetase n=1 Tax=Desulfoluna spongiiphila TaxID=419481 RepID=UPI00125583A3|nr:non-ribosomal peptide synthetase [Desulfoluna spongiiphila]VVS94553.1 amp-dependent synthetase/ligase [Desulfoluna spongiiphila]